MKVIKCSSKRELGDNAARDGADAIRAAIAAKGAANIVIPTGGSQSPVR